jgi:DNA-binding MarR family transcriptional regulator
MYPFYRTLMQYSEDFEREHPDPESRNMLHFATWLNRRLAHDRAPDGSAVQSEAIPVPGETVEVSISRLVGFLGRYARIYLKKVVEDTPLTTPDDFSYLAVLLDKGSLTKIELIEENIHEKTSGMEVIKRLLNSGLIEQKNNPADRRSKSLFLTDQGRGVLFQIFDRLRAVAELVAGDLTEDEKWQLLYLLQRLDRFHRPIYLDRREASLDDLLKR